MRLIGRRSKGTDVDISIETSDPSMDRRHCVINVKRNKQGELIYTLRDNQSITGTFHSSITKENFLDVLIKPGSIIYILLLIVLLMVFMLLNLTMYIVLFDASLRHSRHGLIEYLVHRQRLYPHYFLGPAISGSL